MTSDVPSTAPHTMPWNESILLEVTTIAHKNEQNIAPVIEAEAAIAVDIKNGLILYEKNIHNPQHIASLTKLMTAIIILEENNLNEIATISKNAASTEGRRIWLTQGEKITVENLLYSVLIHSANDAAVALAEYNSKTIETFSEKMNDKAEDIGLLSTSFSNPTGLDEDELPPESSEEVIEETTTTDGNISTAYDMTLLARYAYGKSFVRRAATKKELEVASTNEVIKHKLQTTNELLDSYLNVLGLKTGTTDQAGECLISIIENEEGNNILTVVLNSPARFQETKILADWIFRSYTWS